MRGISFKLPRTPAPLAPNTDGMARRRRSTSAVCLAALLAVAGAAHFVIPRPYERIVPGVFSDPAFWVRWSGVAEIVCAGLVALPRTRRVGALVAAGVFVAVFPANVKMALDGGIPAGLAWARLPLQLPLVLWAWRVAYPRVRTAPAR
jgi:uncharacterized membrane protein